MQIIYEIKYDHSLKLTVLRMNNKILLYLIAFEIFIISLTLPPALAVIVLIRIRKRGIIECG